VDVQARVFLNPSIFYFKIKEAELEQMLMLRVQYKA
jgi:hypothetical protein